MEIILWFVRGNMVFKRLEKKVNMVIYFLLLRWFMVYIDCLVYMFDLFMFLGREKRFIYLLINFIFYDWYFFEILILI